MTGLFGTATGQQLFAGATPQDPVVLARYAGEVTARIAKARLPATRVSGATIDQAALSKELMTKSAALQTALEGIALEQRESQATLVAKNRAIDEYDRVFQGVSTVLTGLFLLAGQDELAERVRPSLRRPGRTAEEDQTPPGTRT